MHKGELWQAYSLSGIPLKDGGYDSALDNPSMGSDFAVGAVDVWLYRRTKNGIEVLFQHRSEFVHNANNYRGGNPRSSRGNRNRDKRE